MGTALYQEVKEIDDYFKRQRQREQFEGYAFKQKYREITRLVLLMLARIDDLKKQSGASQRVAFYFEGADREFPICHRTFQLWKRLAFSEELQRLASLGIWLSEAIYIDDRFSPKKDVSEKAMEENPLVVSYKIGQTEGTEAMKKHIYAYWRQLVRERKEKRDQRSLKRKSEDADLAGHMAAKLWKRLKKAREDCAKVEKEMVDFRAEHPNLAEMDIDIDVHPDPDIANLKRELMSDLRLIGRMRNLERYMISSSMHEGKTFEEACLLY